MSITLTHQEADSLLAMDKHFQGTDQCAFPEVGGNLRIPLLSADRHEEFSLDITRSKIELRKNTFQNRARKAVVLARIDLGGSPHRNPDDAEIPCPHMHVYREGFGDKWAYALPANFTSAQDVWQTLKEFMAYCNIVTRPTITKGLFI